MTSKDVVSGTMLEPKYKKMKIPYEWETETYRCVRCGFCRPSCPIFDAKKVESWNCRGRVMLQRALFEGGLPIDQKALDILYSCTLCKKCEDYCPAKIKVTDVLHRVRKYLAENNYALEEHQAIKNNIFEKGNTHGEDPTVFNKNFGELIESLPKSSPTLFYAGCVGTIDYPDNTIASLKLLQDAGQDFSMLDREYCCGGYLNWLGFEDDFKKEAEKNIQLFQERGIETIITQCPMCATVFQKDYKNLSQNSPNAYHISEVLVKALDEGKIKLTRPLKPAGKVAYKDPCHLGRYSKIYDPPRKLIKSIPGAEFLELPSAKAESKCCGGPIRVPYTDLRNDLTDAIIKDASSKGVNYLVTSCPTCYHSLVMRAWKERIRVIELPRLVAYSAGVVDSYR
jgi:Fe-S oxidoreductase